MEFGGKPRQNVQPSRWLLCRKPRLVALSRYRMDLPAMLGLRRVTIFPRRLALASPAQPMARLAVSCTARGPQKKAPP